MPKQDDLPALLKKWRQKNGLKQWAAAENIGVSCRTYQDWEHGKRKPKPITRKGIDEMMRQYENGDSK
jgi:DNA-binding transcriptional regulator YiaG